MFNIHLLPGRYTSFIRGLYQFTAYSFMFFVLYLLAVNFNLFYLFGKTPSLQTLENPQLELASELIGSDGKVIGKYFVENRTPIEFQQISPNLIKALVAVEDSRFTKHSGIDPRSIFRSISGILTLHKGSGGGSTLTQQLVKNLFEARGERYDGLLTKVPGLGIFIIKTKEWITAITIERRYTKQEIMTMYLNTVSFGSNAYGVRSATKTYFRKEPWELNIEEAAVIAGMLQNPSRFNPRFHPKTSQIRRNIVYGQMVKYNYMNQQQFDRLKDKPIALDYNVESHNTGMAGYFREIMKDELNKTLDELNKDRPEDDQLDLYTSGLRIQTSIDSRMQQYAEQAMTEHMSSIQQKFFEHWKGKNPWRDSDGKELKDYIEHAAKQTSHYRQLKELYGSDQSAIFKEMRKPMRMRVFTWRNGLPAEKDTSLSPMDSIRYYKHILNIGMMAMDPLTGHIKVWVGGVDFRHFKFDHVRQSVRQPGSVFKPFVYATAIDNGYTPCDKVIDQPVTFTPSEDGVGSIWTPQNSNGRFSYRSMTLRHAMGESINSVAAGLMKQFKPKMVDEYARKIGVTSPYNVVPAIALGGIDPGVNLYEMVASYCTFANEGRYTEPIAILRIEDRFGNILREFSPQSRDAIPAQTAYKMLHMLRGAIEEPGATAVRLRSYACYQNNDIGAKTGTTNDYSDGWFMGVTQNLVAGVWVGGDDRSIHFRTLELGQGSRMALPAWGKFMDKVYADETIGLPKIIFKKPSDYTLSDDCSGYGSSSDSTNVIVPTPKPRDEEGLLK